MPENSIDTEVYLELTAIDVSKVPPITLEFGETIVSDVISIEPLGFTFMEPAILSIEHSAVDLPELSTIVIKFYDYLERTWVTLPCHKGR